MKRANLIVLVGFGAGFLMAVQDLVSGPSLNLLAVNSAVLVTLTIASIALLAFNGTGHVWTGAAAAQDRERSPTREVLNLLEGARRGYTRDRKEIARTLRAAVEVKLGGKEGHPSREAVDSYLSKSMGQELFSELLSEDQGNAVRVKPTKEYISNLRTAVASLEMSLET